jgi:hypothetical protein
MLSYSCSGLHLGRISGLFRFNDYSLVEKAYSVMFYVAGLSLERYCVTMASRESVKKWFHKFSKIFSVDVDSGEMLAIYASRGRNTLIAFKFLSR